MMSSIGAKAPQINAPSDGKNSLRSPRIVSLIASSTELLCALGYQDFLVGRSHECDFPESVRALPQLTEPKFVADGTSYEIDQRVKAILQEGLSVYRVDGARLRELRPDIIVTQVQCEVCAVSLSDVEAAVAQYFGPTVASPRIIALNPNSLEDIWRDIRLIASGLDALERGEELVKSLKHRMEVISRRCAEAGGRPRVATVEWISPLMSGGNWMPELVALAGGVNLFGEVGKHSPAMTLEQLASSDPDLIVVTPCGLDIARTEREMPALEASSVWRELRAVRGGRVYLADGNAFFNRPGPRVVESQEILAEIFQNGLCDYGHKGRGWKPYPPR